MRHLRLENVDRHPTSRPAQPWLPERMSCRFTIRPSQVCRVFAQSLRVHLFKKSTPEHCLFPRDRGREREGEVPFSGLLFLCRYLMRAPAQAALKDTKSKAHSPLNPIPEGGGKEARVDALSFNLTGEIHPCRCSRLCDRMTASPEEEHNPPFLSSHASPSCTAFPSFFMSFFATTMKSPEQINN